MDYLKSAAGAKEVERFETAYFDTFADPRWSRFSVQERRERRNLRPTWWAIPARNTTDLATAIFPKMMYERLPEMGLDFSVVYPTMGLITIELQDEELRRASARSLNQLKAETFRGFQDRLTPAALIPMHSPSEAIAELEYAVRELGLKSAMMASYIRRPIPYAAKRWPDAARFTYWMDTFGLDSEHDYDPIWAKCQELGIAPTFHSVGYGWGSRTSNLQLRAQSHWQLRGECRSGLPRPVPGRGAETIPRLALRVPGRWHELGAFALLGAHRSLEQAQRRGDGPLQSRPHRSRRAA